MYAQRAPSRIPTPRNAQQKSVQRRTSSIQRVPDRLVSSTAIANPNGMMNPTYPV